MGMPRWAAAVLLQAAVLQGYVEVIHRMFSTGRADVLTQAYRGS